MKKAKVDDAQLFDENEDDGNVDEENDDEDVSSDAMIKVFVRI